MNSHAEKKSASIREIRGRGSPQLKETGHRGERLRSTTISSRDAAAKLPELARKRSVPLFQHGTLTVKLYAPRGADQQTPHKQDEVYVVISGIGEFVCEGERRHFGPHDFLFVRAGVEHHFENFSDDFVVWVFFYGPEGGEPDYAASGNL